MMCVRAGPRRDPESGKLCNTRARLALTRSFRVQCKAVPQHAVVHSSGFAYSIIPASSASQLRALAYLRAACFHEYPKDRSEFARRSHCRMRADQEWQSLELKLQGTEIGWKHTTVVPLLALAPSTSDDEVTLALLNGLLDLSAQVPASDSAADPMLPVGGLDLNVGMNLPAEELIGQLPKEDATTKRAYLSNICVAEGARRLGVAKALIKCALVVAQKMGVLQVYVHVVQDNAAAIALYQMCGFTVEAEEDADTARKRQHGRRLLLRTPL
eukprot:jgi/Ulvmu1/6202/UM028_0058.1